MRVKVISYKERLVETIIEINNFIWLGIAIFFTAIGMPWFALIVWYIVFLIFLYFSYKRAGYYIYDVIDKNEIIEFHFLYKNSDRIYIVNKKFIKIDFIDNGAYNIKIYEKSHLLIRQYAVGEWTLERMSNFCKNYDKRRVN